MRTRKVFLAVAMVLLTVMMCSCSQLITRELPLEKRLTDDVLAYLDAIAGNKVLLYDMKIDRRDYREAEGTLTYDCTAYFAWDEFSGESYNQITANYVLTDGEWILASVQSDVDPADLDGRLVMRSLFTEAVDLPDAVRDALTCGNAVMSDTLLNFTVTLQGATYRFPCNFTDFMLNGWEIAPESGLTALSTIAPQAQVSVPMVNEDAVAALSIANQTDHTIYVGEGVCAGVSVRSGSGSIALARGITEQSSAEDVIAAYGTPDTDETTFDGRRLTYQTAEDSRVNFVFTADGTQVDIFTLRPQADMQQTAPLFDTYQFGISLDGVSYTLPERLDTFLNNGWTITGTAGSDDIIRWYESKLLTLQSGDSSVEVVVRNPSMGDMRLYAATVTEIILDRNHADAALVNADGAALALDQPADAILAALGEPSRDERIAGNQVTTYSAGDGRFVRLTFGDAVIAVVQAAEADETVTNVLDSAALTVELSSSIYVLPAAAKEFKDMVWIPQSGWPQAMQAGSFLQMSMEDRRSEEITAYFVNTGSEIARLENCAIAGFYWETGDADIIIGQSLLSGASTSEALSVLGIPAYDIREGNTRYLVYGASINRFLCVRCTDKLVDALWIVCFTYQ